MIMDTLNEYLETVAGYVFDDDKLVTYKWLSKDLEVHVDVAKTILWKFWKKFKEEKSFVCTYLLMGSLPDNGIRVEVVKDENLLTSKKKYSQILSEHIYSIQKALPEIQLLANTENGDVRYSAIKCIANNERSEEEMHKLRWGALSEQVPSTSEEKANSVPTPEKTEKVSPERKSADKKKGAQKKGFDNLFGKASNKQKTISTSADTNQAENSSKDNVKQTKDVTSGSSKKSTQNGLSNFLQPKKIEEKTAKRESPEPKKDSESVLKEVTEKRDVSENKKPTKNMKRKKRNRSNDDRSTAKKRKRITIKSDSSDIESSDEEQKMELESSAENISPVKVRPESPPKAKIENGKRKVLKVMDKTFEEDGFLVTKKVQVYESCSDDETQVTEANKPVATEPRSEHKGKKQTKQTTLMNFFKKS